MSYKLGYFVAYKPFMPSTGTETFRDIWVQFKLSPNRCSGTAISYTMWFITLCLRNTFHVNFTLNSTKMSLLASYEQTLKGG